jgi:ribosome-binding protein aMBF1 (putative translation factor)
MATIGWTRATLACQIKVAHTTVTYWCDGRTTPPENVLAWVERLAVLRLKNPPPPIRHASGRRPNAT